MDPGADLRLRLGQYSRYLHVAKLVKSASHMEQIMDHPTPHAVLGLFRQLSPEHKTEFIQLMGQESNADQFGEFYNALPKADMAVFMRPLLEHVVSVLRPILIREAIPIVRQFPTLSVEELIEPISAAYERSLTEVEEGLSIREQHRFKAQRERQSSPETIRRNVEICDLRGRDSERWTQGALAIHFQVTDGYIRRVLREEAKWRRLFAALGTN